MEHRPPFIAQKLLRLFCHEQFHEEVEGDLEELFETNVEQRGLSMARLLYWGDVFKHFNLYFITRRPSGHSSLNLLTMWINYLKIAFRNMLKYKGYATLNILGLSVGLSAAMLILLYVLHERSFDRFHEQAENTYVVHTRLSGSEDWMSSAPNAFVPAVGREFPEVVTGVRMFNRGSYRPYVLQYKDQVFQEDRLFHTDSTFFSVFSFDLLKGDPKACLQRPKSIVLTERMAAKYFGDSDPMGKVLKVDNRSNYEVTGVVADPPHNSHMHFDFLVSYSSFTNSFFKNERWDNASYTSYLVLEPAASPDDLEAKLPQLVSKAMESDRVPDFALQPLLDIHLNGLGTSFSIEPQNEMRFLVILAAIGLLILLIASINYVNLATARAAQRAKEIGIRKVVGAYRWHLFNQFLGESVLFVFLATLFGFFLAWLALPFFNPLADRSFTFADLLSLGLLWRVGLMAVLLSLLAGFYPAAVLSGFRPIVILKGSFKSSKKGVLMRKGLVTAQFIISMGLIIATTVVLNQLEFIQTKSLGYNRDNMLLLPMSNSVQRNYAAFKAEMLREPGILDVTRASESPTQIDGGYSFIIKDHDEALEVSVAVLRTDIDFLGAMQMELVAGSFISEVDVQNIHTDIPYEERIFGFVFNEEALLPFGLSAEEAIGKRVYMNGRNGVIRGVVKNFHFASMREKIKPMAFLPDRDFNHILLRISGQDIPGTLSKVQERWRKLAPNVPFAFEFMDQEFGQLYKAEQRLSVLFAVFAGIAVFIACFGLLGLISYATVQKAREIGVRKVLGASVGQLVYVLNKDFISIILIAFTLTAPLTYLIMEGWLSQFAYRTGFGFAPVFLALGMTAAIAFLTISLQSFRAAQANPVDVLKQE